MTTRRIEKLLSGASLLALALLGASLATQASAAAAAAPADATVDAVIVTAERRAERLQDVPIAAAAFSAEQIRQLGADQLQDLIRSIPNVTLYDDRGAGQPTWVIRGVGLADFNQNNTPAAATFYDDFYLPSNAVSGMGLYDIGGIEVLKGPQGGLYGRNTSSGAVLLNSTTPKLGSFSGYVDGSYGRWDRKQAQGAINIPIGDQVAVRLAGTLDRGGGWQDSLATPQNDHWGDHDLSAIRGQIRWQPISQIDINLKIEGGKDDSQTLLGRSIGTEDLSKSSGFCPALLAGHLDDATCGNWADRNRVALHLPPGPSVSAQSKDATRVLSDPINQLHNTWRGANLRSDADLGFATLSSITGVLHYVNRQVFDYDGTALVLGHENSHVRFNVWSQEFRLVSKDSGPLTWLAGAVYNHDGIDDVRTFDFAQNQLTAPAPVNFVRRSYHQSTNSWAIYGNAGYNFTEQLRVHASVRYTDEDKKMLNATIAVPPINLTLFSGLNQDLKLQNHWTGDAGVDYHIEPDKMVYGKVTRGYKSGGFFGGFSTSATNLLPYKEESITSYEAGAKTVWEHDFQINGAAYYYDYKDKQGYINQLNPPPFTGTANRLGNIGDEHLYGVEAEAVWTPSSVPGLELQFAPSYYKGKVYKTSSSSVTVTGLPLSLLGSINPQWSYTAMAKYEHPVFDKFLGTVQLNYFRHGFGNGGSTATTDPVSAAIFHIDDYGQLDGRIAIATDDRHWELALEVHNLTNTAYDTVVTRDSGGSYIGLYNQPRNWRLQLHYSW